jgi:KDO2-lipid IV(A) lauroyltransferase
MVASRTPTSVERLAAAALITGVSVLRRLPDRPVYRTAWLIGLGLSVAMRRRRALVRSNLQRVCRWLDEAGTASPRVRAAAHDARALSGLVRDAFGHWVVGYAEAAIAPRYTADELQRRVRIDRPEVAAEALAPRRPGEPGRLYVSLHLGSIDLAGVYAARLGSVPVVAPMETVANPALARYFQQTRSDLGLRPVPAAGAVPELRAALRRGEGVGLVADRVVIGQGARVGLFGAPARLPAGPAVLAVESGAPLYLLALRRDGLGRWAGRVERVRAPREGRHRERVQATLDAQARAFERFVADSPEQWWTVFFPIWEAPQA